MAAQRSPRQSADSDYPIKVRTDDVSLAMRGDVLITGTSAEKIRRWVLNYPEHYMKLVVPFIREREATYRPEEAWIDPAGRIHITNARIAARVRRHFGLHALARRQQAAVEQAAKGAAAKKAGARKVAAKKAARKVSGKKAAAKKTAKRAAKKGRR